MKSKNVFKHIAFAVALLTMMACSPQSNTITILHTNDTHSQVEPIPAGKRDGNHAGYARRMGMITQERELDPNLILVDAGDFSQGTPYFNLFHGRVEVEAMNQMGYDAITLGNHEFDNGIDTLAAVLQNAHFAVVNANYDVTGTALEGIVKPYVILRRAGMKIGILGLGVDPKGLVSIKNFEPIKYLDPIPVAQEIAEELKLQHHCDLIICLSHLGTYENAYKPSDTQLAKSTRYIDVIIGGHTHKTVTNHYVQNMDGDSVLLAQMGKSGAKMGKITLKMTE
jgi:5'-nucleotidase